MQFLEAERARHAESGAAPVEWALFLEVTAAIAHIDPAEREPVLSGKGLDVRGWSRAEQYWMCTLALDLERGQVARAEEYGRACAWRPGLTGEGALGEPAQLPAEHAQRESAPATSMETPRPNPSATPAGLAAGREVTEIPSFLRTPISPQDAPTVAQPGLASAAAPVPPSQLPWPPPSATPLLPAVSFPGRKAFDATLDLAPGQAAVPLPFGQAPSPEYAARLGTAPGPAAAPTRRAGHEATRIDTGPAAGPATPFGPSGAPASLPALSLEQHAMLSAELAVQQDGPSRAAVLFRYGVEGIQALTALGAHWRERLQQDPAASSRWKAVYEQHRTRHQEKAR